MHIFDFFIILVQKNTISKLKATKFSSFELNKVAILKSNNFIVVKDKIVSSTAPFWILVEKFAPIFDKNFECSKIFCKDGFYEFTWNKNILLPISKSGKFQST